MQRQREALLVGEHVLAERRAEIRQPLDDLRQVFFRCAVERGAGAAKGRVVALQHAFLLGGKAECIALLHQGIDAVEQVGVGVESVPVARHLRRKLALDLKERVIAVRSGQKMKHLLDPGQRPPAHLQRGDGIGKIRQLGAAGDCRDLGFVFGKGACIGGSEMCGLDLAERRDLAGGRPVREKGVVGAILRVHAGSTKGRCRLYIGISALNWAVVSEKVRPHWNSHEQA